MTELNEDEEKRVYEAIRHLGEASIDEILEHLKEKEELDVSKSKCYRYIGRLRAKKEISMEYTQGNLVYHLRNEKW